MRRARSPLAAAAILLALGAFGPARAASSWELSELPGGSGRWVESFGTSVWVLGRFGEANVWRSDDGGFRGTKMVPGLPFPADSVRAFSLGRTGGFLLDRSGGIWASPTGSRWQGHPGPPDSAGAPTCLLVRGADLWVGTAIGWILRSPIAADDWRRIGAAPGGAILDLFPVDPEGVVVRLDDGTVMAQDTVWTAAPFLASAVEVEARTGIGRALEQETLRLWRTEDGGRSWSLYSEALARPDLAGRASGARMLRFPERNVGLIPCGDALLASDDGGRTFRVAADGTGMFLDAAIDELGEVVTAGSRIHRSTDGARTLKLALGGEYEGIEIGGRRTFWALDAGLLLSVDRGESWLRQPLPRSAGRLRRIAALGEYGIWLQFDDGLVSEAFRSDDRGATYRPIDAGGALRGAAAWRILGSGHAWAATDSTVLCSDDGGESWTVAGRFAPPLRALAALDSATAAVGGGDRILLTRDRGARWLAGTLPTGFATAALSFASESLIVAVGPDLLLLPGDPPWVDPPRFSFGDSLRDAAMAPDGAGWAVGASGLLVGTRDFGKTWSREQTDLEIALLDAPLSIVRAIDRTHAVAGGGSTLLRWAPDGTGPDFRFGISANPRLPRYLDLHVTAHERLRGDTLRAWLDGTPIEAELSDPEGYLYRIRVRLPDAPLAGVVRVQGSDWAGNERTATRMLAAARIDPIAGTTLRWDGERYRVEGDGEAPSWTAWIESGEPLPDPPAGWRPAGRPFRRFGDLPAASPIGLGAGLSLALLTGDGWRVSGEEAGGAADAPFLGGTFLPVRGSAPPPPGGIDSDPLRIHPNPSDGRIRLARARTASGPVHWSIHDLAGRRLGGGSISPEVAAVQDVRLEDARGRPLPSGVYWIRARDAQSDIARRLVVAR